MRALQKFGLLSTYDLFYLVRMVGLGELAKDKAREIIKMPALIKAPRS